MNKAIITVNGVRYVSVKASGCTECAFFENCKDLCAVLELPFDLVFKKIE